MIDKEESQGRGLRKIGEGIALAALIAGAVTLEIHGKPKDGLWILILVWCFFI